MRLEAWQDLSSVHRLCSQTAFFLLKVRYRRCVDAFPDSLAGLETSTPSIQVVMDPWSHAA